MIKAQNITKTYHSQKGDSCVAVNDVSLSFPDNGLVFICGKSGSGKSTLLNVLSGLDKSDSGEIIVADKSTKDFTVSDFDSYRNTYVGYIFQDFGLIDELSVSENIALSSQLQNTVPTKKEVEKALAQVGLDGFATRKVNELSGGQRQRVSVARAILKDSKILFADEPTGNLDADTSNQIFTLFKELSEDRLVIVVTHDIESAINFGGRIVTLANGEVVSDKTKTAQSKVEEFNTIVQDTVNKYFSDTKEVATQPKHFESKRTHMPMKTAAKIAFSSFKARKMRFAFTLSLGILALTIFFLADFMNRFDYNTAVLNSLRNHDIQTLVLTNQEEIEISGETFLSPTYFTQVEIDKFDSPVISYSFAANISPHPATNGFGTTFNRVVEVLELSSFYGSEILLGREPVANLLSIEILISDYTANSIMRHGGSFTNRNVFPNTGLNNLLDAIFISQSVPFQIVGIFSTDHTQVTAQNQLRFNREHIYQAMLTAEGALNNFIENHLAGMVPPEYVSYLFPPVTHLYVDLYTNHRVNVQLLEFLDENNIQFHTYFTRDLEMMGLMFEFFGPLMGYASIVMFLFVMLLIFNFISSSVISKMREIGILRAIGARGIDTAKIFAVEGFFIFIATVIVSILLAAGGVGLLNRVLSQYFESHLNILSFNPISILLGSLAIFGTIILACAIPLIRTIRLKPMETIRRG